MLTRGLTRVRWVDIVTGALGFTFWFCPMAAGGLCRVGDAEKRRFLREGAREVDDASGLLAGISFLRWAGRSAGALGWEADSASALALAVWNSPYGAF